MSTWPVFDRFGNDDFCFGVVHKNNGWRDHSKLNGEFRHSSVFNAIYGDKGVERWFQTPEKLGEVFSRHGPASFIVIWSEVDPWALVFRGEDVALIDIAIVKELSQKPELAAEVLTPAFASSGASMSLDDFAAEYIRSGMVCCYGYHKTDEFGSFRGATFHSDKKKLNIGRLYVISNCGGDYFFEGVFDVTSVDQDPEKRFGMQFVYTLHDHSRLEGAIPVNEVLSRDYLRKKVSGGIPFLSVPVKDQLLFERLVADQFSEPSSNEEYLAYLGRIELDKEGAATRRGEASYVRNKLFRQRKFGQCVLCGSNFPVELLVAAHIRKRSQCDDRMKLDFENNVFPMCRFGCDELFERGFVVVDHEGRIRRNYPLPLPTDSRAEGLLAVLEDSECNAYGDNTKAYFEWHFEYHRRDGV
jgi:hypothetical protein